MHSGRKPNGSRAAISFRGDMTTIEYAPLSTSMLRETASSIDFEESRSRVMT